MKAVIKVSAILVLFIMVVSCATTRHALPERYNLDNYLKAADQIFVNEVSDYENVDNQSIILEADRDDYYLLVLREPIAIEDSYGVIAIDVENTSSKDKALSPQDLIDRSRYQDRDGSTDEIISDRMASIGNDNSGLSTRSFQTPSKVNSYRFPPPEGPSSIKRIVLVSGHDRIVAGEKYYIIEKIYKLKGKEQAEEIKKRLRDTRRTRPPGILI